MGAVELQVFVSLVVILGAAFVALICDFLKGNNEQLRESNIELRVRQDERERRDVLVERVQRQTLEAVAQTQRALGARGPVARETAAPQHNAAPVTEAQTPHVAANDTRALFEQAEQERRRNARRERRRQAPPPPPAAETTVQEEPNGAAWAQQVFLRRYPQPETAPPVSVEPPVENVTAPVPAPIERPIALELSPLDRPTTGKPADQPEYAVAESGAEMSVQPAAVQCAESVPERTETLVALSAEPFAAMQSPLQRTEMPPAAPLAPSVPATLTEMDVRRKELVPAAAESMMPMGLTPLAAPLPVVLPAEALEASQPEVLPALKAPLAELEPTIAGELEIASPAAFTSQVGSDAAPAESQTPAEIEPCLPESALQVEQPSPEMPAEAAEPTNVVRIRVLRDDDLVAPVSEPVEETISLPELASEQTPAVEPEPEPDVETVSAVEPEQVVEPEPEVETASAMELEPEIEFLSEIAPPRPKVVEMRAQAPSAALAELEVPGGFHEPEVLARLLTEEAPFNGLAIAISPADYVRLLADLGKQAMEQLMGTISRMVVAMTREHDFACRIAEDEFILLFVGETGGAAKRRTQLVSERLWDFQLRSLGSTSVIFSWGAMESTNQTLAQAIEGARERMLETRRSRRVSGVGGNRFRNRLAI